MSGGGLCLRALCSQSGLLAAVVCYVLLGALLFHHLESGPEQQRKATVQASRDDCLRELWLITERLNVLYERNWTRLVHAQLRRFERAVVAGARADRDPQWGLPGSLLYALTLVTTVGWGSAAPRTAAGKAAGMIYALLGAPLLLLWLAAAGGLLARLARRVAARCRPQAVLNHHQMDNHFQLHEQHSLLGSSQRSSHYASRESQCSSGATTGHYAPQHIVHAAGARYSHIFQRVPASPRNHGDTLGRNKHAASNSTIECFDAECHQTATTSASGTPRRCCQQGSVLSAGSTTPRAPGTPARIKAATHQAGDLNSIDDTLDTDESEGECICSHDTPSRVPLIWRSQGGQTTCKDDKQKSCASTPASALSHDHQALLQQGPPFPVAVVLLFLTGYLCLGATVFSVWEGWSFLDSVYFCFITISTIGFGDFAPGQTGSKLASNPSDSNKNEHVHLFACCAYLIFGLVLVAMSFSLVQEEVTAKCAQVANALGLVKH